MNEVAVFLTTGTGANINIACGFVPAKVEVVNTASANLETLLWVRGMADESAFKTKDSTRSKITTLGITPLGATQADASPRGFRVGADTDVNVLGEALTILAYRGGPGNQV